MNKVLVEVYVPAINNKFDAYIPLESKIEEIGLLLANGIVDLTDNKYKKGREITVSDFSTGKEYDKKMRVFETNIDNGTKIVLS